MPIANAMAVHEAQNSADFAAKYCSGKRTISQKARNRDHFVTNPKGDPFFGTTDPGCEWIVPVARISVPEPGARVAAVVVASHRAGIEFASVTAFECETECLMAAMSNIGDDVFIRSEAGS